MTRPLANPPTAEVLRQLYCGENLTAVEAAARLGVSPAYVKQCLHRYGIPTRPTGRGLAHRGVEGPTREELHRLIHVEHLFYAEIARMYGVDASAITHWVRKHGIDPPLQNGGRRRGVEVPALDEPKLRRLYESGLSTPRIGTLYGRTADDVRKLCRRYGIPLRPQGWTWGGDPKPAQDGHLVRSAYELEVCDWLSSHSVPHVYEPTLPNPVFKGDFLANGWYIEVWGVVNDPVYSERRARKEAIYKAHDLPLIGIEACYFRTATRLDKKLRACLKPVISPLGF